MADGEEYIIGWSKPSWLFWSQQSHIDLHYLMVSAWKFVIITITIKVQFCHWRRAGRDDRKESSFLLKQKDDSNGKLSCTSLPSGYDATVLGGTAVWATILKNSWEAKKQECLAAGSIKQEGKKKKRGLVNRTSIWVFYWLCALPKHCMDGCLLQGWLKAVGWSSWSLYEQHSEAPDSPGEGNEGLNDCFKVCPRLEETGWLEVWAL